MSAIFAGQTIQRLTLDGREIPCTTVQRYRQRIVPAIVPAGLSQVEAIATYGDQGPTLNP